ncbi:MAG: serine/threonine protein kinase [Candidatus Obscuribacter sp.]|nr:serine/threonine protein kinase [Candidatus Obscuribacter sp.]
MKTEVKKQTQYPLLKPENIEDIDKIWSFCLIAPALSIPLGLLLTTKSELALYLEIFSLLAGAFLYLFTGGVTMDGSSRSELELKAKGLDIRDTRLDAIMPWDWLTKVEIRQRKLSLIPNYVYFAFKDGSNVLILWNDVKETMDSTTLISCVRTWAPHAEIIGDAKLTKSESIATYTELWLKELTGAKSEKRLRQNQVLSQGTLLNDTYTIQRVLSGGGQGTAYLADTRSPDATIELPPQVVIKELILPDNDRGLKHATDALIKEVAILRRINCPNIVQLYDFFIEDMRGYLAIEYIDGITLRQLIAQSGPLPCARVAQLGIAMCSTLIYLHDLSPPIVHGDFTPDNIMLDKNEKLKVLDFDASQELTRNKTNTVVGKHSYMSPEQFKGILGEPSDIYAAGCTLYYLLTGQDPEPISQSHPNQIVSTVSEEMDAIVSNATALDTTARYPNLREMRLALGKL